jgi:hypothetical protein
VAYHNGERMIVYPYLRPPVVVRGELPIDVSLRSTGKTFSYDWAPVLLAAQNRRKNGEYNA